MIAIDLPGWKGKRRVHHFTSVSEALRLVRTGKVASTAGHAGAIKLYRDRASDYRGQLCSYRVVPSEICTADFKKLAVWFRENLPKIGDAERFAWDVLIREIEVAYAKAEGRSKQLNHKKL